MNKSIFEQELWDAGWDEITFFTAGETDKVRIWLEKYIPKDKKNCIEIGCFPGRYLAIFGKYDYLLSGIDLTPRVKSDLPRWLIDNKYKVDEFFMEDFNSFKSKKTYDVVSSFGFIEHFDEWEVVLQKHINLVSDDGFLILSVPNFRGFVQRILHILFDRENYRRHVIKAMQVKKWADILKKQGFEIKFCGHYGEFEFWTNWQKRNRFQLFFLNRINQNMSILKKLFFFNSSLSSPFCGVVAQKVKNE